MQLYGFAVSHHGLFSITGAFHNPGPFSGFVVSGLPLALAMILFAKSQAAILSKKLFYQILYYLLQISAWITLVSILLVLPPAQSRAAWIAGIIGVTFFVFRFPGKIFVRDSFVSRFKRMKRRVRLLISILVLAVVVASATGIYLFKQGSADGRLLIWRVTTEIIKQKAFVGHGTDAFNALYMDEQANWFASGKGNEAQTMVAGSPQAPFNELLKLWLEKGFVGVLIAGVIVFYILRGSKCQKIPPIIKQISADQFSSQGGLILGLQGALITLLVFSFFSYPFDISPFLLQLVVAVAVLAGYSKHIIQFNKNIKWLTTLPFSLLLVFATIHFVPQRKVYYQALKAWHEADRLYHFGTYNSAVEAYEAAVPILKTNGLFLQMYGKALSMDEQYEKSSEVLVQAQKKYSSQIIQNTLGDNHKALGNFVKAESAYLKSANMIPSLIYPKYLLTKLYNADGQHQKAIQTAEKILNSTVKVESSATKEIMREMKNINSEQ
jgi:hypothetical protein